MRTRDGTSRREVAVRGRLELEVPQNVPGADEAAGLEGRGRRATGFGRLAGAADLRAVVASTAADPAAAAGGCARTRRAVVGAGAGVFRRAVLVGTG